MALECELKGKVGSQGDTAFSDEGAKADVDDLVEGGEVEEMEEDDEDSGGDGSLMGSNLLQEQPWEAFGREFLESARESLGSRSQ